jgi:hypothetical protein
MESKYAHETTLTHTTTTGSLVLCLSDGGQVALAFQCGALCALRELGLLRQCRILAASGSGNTLLTALVHCLTRPNDVWGTWGVNVSASAIEVAGGGAEDNDETSMSRTATTASEEEARLLSTPPKIARSDAWFDQFLPRMRRYCCANIEQTMFWERVFSSPWRWLADDVTREYVRAVHAIVGRSSSPPSPSALQMSETNQAPRLLWNTTSTDGKQLITYTNSAKVPAETREWNVSIDVAATLPESNASMPLVWGGSCSATRLDPLALRTASLYAIQCKATARACLLLLDGFSNSQLAASSLSAGETVAVGDQISAVGQPWTTSDTERLLAYRQRVVQLYRHDALPRLARSQIPVLLRSHEGLVGMTNNDFNLLVNAGYQLAYCAFDPEQATTAQDDHAWMHGCPFP